VVAPAVAPGKVAVPAASAKPVLLSAANAAADASASATNMNNNSHIVSHGSPFFLTPSANSNVVVPHSSPFGNHVTVSNSTNPAIPPSNIVHASTTHPSNLSPNTNVNTNTNIKSNHFAPMLPPSRIPLPAFSTVVQSVGNSSHDPYFSPRKHHSVAASSPPSSIGSVSTTALSVVSPMTRSSASCCSPPGLGTPLGGAMAASRQRLQVSLPPGTLPIASRSSAAPTLPQPAVAPAGTPSPSLASTPWRGCFQAEVLKLPVAGPVDPAAPAQRSYFQQALGVSSTASIEALQGFRGGLNDGVWFVKDGQADLVLKLVRGCRRIPQELTEGEQLQKLFREHQSLPNDPAVAFPFKVLSIHGPTGPLGKDIIAMSRAPGKALACVMSDYKLAGKSSEMAPVFKEVGTVVGAFHNRYRKQHGDLQGSNVFFDPATNRVTMIDLGGMGIPMGDNDEQHFLASLRMMASFYGAANIESYCSAFQAGLVIGRQQPVQMPAPPSLPVAKRGVRKAIDFEAEDGEESPKSPSKRLALTPKSAKETTTISFGEEPSSPTSVRPIPSRFSTDAEDDEEDDEDVPWYQALRAKIFGEAIQEEQRQEEPTKEEDTSATVAGTSTGAAAAAAAAATAAAAAAAAAAAITPTTAPPSTPTSPAAGATSSEAASAGPALPPSPTRATATAAAATVAPIAIKSPLTKHRTTAAMVEEEGWEEVVVRASGDEIRKI